MIAAFGTLVFLSTLWLLVVVGAAVLEESGESILAALRGEQPAQSAARVAPLRVRSRGRLQQPMRASARWRDAA